MHRGCFQHYVAQDAHFLSFFGKAYAAALTKCTDELSAHAPAIQGLLDGVEKELKLHEAFAADWGVDLSQHVQPSPATKDYTDFLMETCQTEVRSISWPTRMDIKLCIAMALLLQQQGGA